MLKMAVSILIVVLFSLAISVNISAVRAESAQKTGNSAPAEIIKAQIAEAFNEMEKEMDIRIALIKEYIGIFNEAMVLYEKYGDKCGVSKEDINNCAAETVEADISLKLTELARGALVENKTKVIEEFIKKNGATEESLAILTSIIENEKKYSAFFKEEYLDPSKKFLQEIKEKIKASENQTKE